VSTFKSLIQGDNAKRRLLVIMYIKKAGPFLTLPSPPSTLDTISLKPDQGFSSASSFSLGSSKEAMKQHGGGSKGNCGRRARDYNGPVGAPSFQLNVITFYWSIQRSASSFPIKKQASLRYSGNRSINHKRTRVPLNKIRVARSSLSHVHQGNDLHVAVRISLLS
jgi:hypothetical protein